MISLLSPAKINLFLRVYAKGSDGYHQLASLMQAISLFDRLELSLAEEDQLTCSNPAIPTDGNNLILKAAELFRQKTGLKSGLHCELEKNIPHEAGLGGGSGNAATTLWGLNELHGRPANEADLRTWSAELGSDISFFFSSGSAYCTGRGEQLRLIAPLPKRQLWVVKPSFGLSTAKVYGNYQAEHTEDNCPSFALKQAISGQIQTFNDLETPAFFLEPSLRDLKDQLYAQGAQEVLMSGSGTAFFVRMDQQPRLPDGYRAYQVEFSQRALETGWYSASSLA